MRKSLVGMCVLQLIVNIYFACQFFYKFKFIAFVSQTKKLLKKHKKKISSTNQICFLILSFMHPSKRISNPFQMSFFLNKAQNLVINFFLIICTLYLEYLICFPCLYYRIELDKLDNYN